MHSVKHLNSGLYRFADFSPTESASYQMVVSGRQWSSVVASGRQWSPVVVRSMSVVATSASLVARGRQILATDFTVSRLLATDYTDCTSWLAGTRVTDSTDLIWVKENENGLIIDK